MKMMIWVPMMLAAGVLCVLNDRPAPPERALRIPEISQPRGASRVDLLPESEPRPQPLAPIAAAPAPARAAAPSRSATPIRLPSQELFASVRQARSARQRSVLLVALVRSTRPAARKTLRRLLLDLKVDLPQRQALLNALQQLKSPGPELLEAIARYADLETDKRLADNALVLLGRLGHNHTERVRTELERRYKIEPRAVLLEALGELGDAQSLNHLSEVLRGKDAKLRAGAVSAIGKIRTAEADRMLLRALQADRDPKVRMQALIPLALRATPESIAALTQALLEDSNDGVRLATLEALRFLKSRSQVREALVRAAGSDKSRRVRARAAELVR